MMNEIIYGLAYACLFFLGFAIIVLLIAFRRQIFCPIYNFVRRVCFPPLNNWVFLGLIALTTLLFLIAIYQGGGEPLGLQALKETAKEEESQIVKYYSGSVEYFTTGSEKPSPPPVLPQSKTWRWWKVAFGTLFVTIIFIPLAFWDEAVRAWHRAHEFLEQRPVRIQLRSAPQPQTPDQPGPQPQAPRRPQPALYQSVWQRFKERFLASLSADVITETVFGFIGQFLRQRLAGRR